MSAESALYAILSGSSGVTALVGARVYPDVIPQDQALPAIAYARSGTEPVVTIHGTVEAEFAQMSVQCWAESRTSAEQVAQAVSTALSAAGEAYTNRGVLFDQDAGLFGAVVDVTLFSVV